MSDIGNYSEIEEKGRKSKKRKKGDNGNSSGEERAYLERLRKRYGASSDAIHSDSDEERVDLQNELAVEVEEASKHLRNFNGYKENYPGVLDTARETVEMGKDAFEENMTNITLFSGIDPSTLNKRDIEAYIETLRNANEKLQELDEAVQDELQPQDKMRIESEKASRHLGNFNEYKENHPDVLDKARETVKMDEDTFKKMMANITVTSSIDSSTLSMNEIEDSIEMLKKANEKLQELDEAVQDELEKSRSLKPQEKMRVESEKASGHLRNFNEYKENHPDVLDKARKTVKMDEDTFKKMMANITVTSSIDSSTLSMNDIEDSIKTLRTANEKLRELDEAVQKHKQFDEEVKDSSRYITNFSKYQENDLDIMNRARKTVKMRKGTFKKMMANITVTSSIDSSTLSMNDIEDSIETLKKANKKLQRLDEAAQKHELHDELQFETTVASDHLRYFISYRTASSEILGTVLNAARSSREALDETIEDIKEIVNTDASSQSTDAMKKSIETLKKANEELQKLDEAVQAKFSDPDNRNYRVAGKQRLVDESKPEDA